jgi:hypothetical protein
VPTVKQLATILDKAGIDTASLVPAYKIGRQQVYRMTVPGTEAVPTWKRLRKLVPKTGHWPVLLGPDEDLELLEEEIEDAEGQTPAQVLRKAAKYDGPDTFAAWHEELVENCRESLEMSREEGDAKWVKQFEELLAQPEPFQCLPRGEWPEDVPPAENFYVPNNVLTKKPHPAVHVALVPTANGWEVPAFLMFGAFNDCPHPEDHVAVMKDWHDRYGAEVVAITHDIVETVVARPPRSRKKALELAREQYLYCKDIVDQGTETIDHLAATLLGGKVWFFWWD